MLNIPKQFKVILIGRKRVGKTSIRRNYFGEQFQHNYSLTIGADFAVKRIDHPLGEFILQIWDIAGQETFHHVRKLYYSASDGAFIVFDITDRKSFDDLDGFLEEFLNEISYSHEMKVPIIVLGNKVDLIQNGEKQAAVSEEEIEKKVEALSLRTGNPIKFYYTSAKTGENIEKAFNHMIEYFIEKHNQQTKREKAQKFK
ncbi:MAG: GTP-binding protein [Methanobacteriota archaeon]|nr:MAG: GTP-binding protein [Euryarchaeota archaeon]